MQASYISPALSQALHRIVHYRTPQIVNEDIRMILTDFIERDAQKGFGTFLFEVLPQVNNIFDFIASARKELEETPAGGSRGQQDDSCISFQAVIDRIVVLMAPVRIYNLGGPGQESKEPIDLLVVLPKGEKKNFRDCEALIHMIHVGNREVNFTLYQMHQLNQYIERGSLFYIAVCRPENLVYDDGGEALTTLLPRNMPAVLDEAKMHFYTGYRRGQAFLEGAMLFAGKNKREMAAFMLHQAAELTLRGMIMAVTGIENRNHSILSLLKHCRRFAPELYHLFPAGTEEEKRLIGLMESAYLNARYKNGFDVTQQELHALQGRMQLLLQHACALFERITATFNFVHDLDK